MRGSGAAPCAWRLQERLWSPRKQLSAAGPGAPGLRSGARHSLPLAALARVIHDNGTEFKAEFLEYLAQLGAKPAPAAAKKGEAEAGAEAEAGSRPP